MTKLIEIWEKIKNQSLNKLIDLKQINSKYYKLAFHDGSKIKTTDTFKKNIKKISLNKKILKNKSFCHFVEIIKIFLKYDFELSPLKFIQIAYHLGHQQQLNQSDQLNQIYSKLEIEYPTKYVIGNTLDYFIMDSITDTTKVDKTVDSIDLINQKNKTNKSIQSNKIQIKSNYYKQYIRYKLLYLKIKKK